MNSLFNGLNIMWFAQRKRGFVTKVLKAESSEEDSVEMNNLLATTTELDYSDSILRKHLSNAIFNCFLKIKFVLNFLYVSKIVPEKRLKITEIFFVLLRFEQYATNSS